ncbi:MAG: hypothetical protein Q8O84_05330 [Nanoarchaeota archaeon]|nr:hypothetical protein [Nanoarchaeota archaeon]
MLKKGQLNISFGWLFAIIVGAVILFLAILGATKVIKIGQSEEQAVGAKELGILLNPLETGFESASSTPLALRVETRIFNKCSPSGNFGKQGIQTSEFSFNKWSPPGVESSFENKYIFSKTPAEGKKFYIFSKPFEFPFKVSDLIYLTSENEKYCFDDAPEDIAEEISQLNQVNLAADCLNADDKTIKVCFNKNCDIRVYYDGGYLQKGKDKIYFEEDSLMYAAIFSDKEIYECQVERLMKRTKQLAELYKEKELLISQKNCETSLGTDLDLLINQIGNAKDYKIINKVADLVEEIEDKNKYAECELW